MREIVRVGLRVVAVIGIVLACGGLACIKPLGEISYAPGHGYVVKLEHHGPPSYERFYYYYVFDTYEQAKHFVDTRYTDPNWPATNLATIYQNQRDQIEYDKITKLLGPPPLNTPLAIPDLPEPIPQSPL